MKKSETVKKSDIKVFDIPLSPNYSNASEQENMLRAKEELNRVYRKYRDLYASQQLRKESYIAMTALQAAGELVVLEDSEQIYEQKIGDMIAGIDHFLATFRV
jgi:hypothetical protein